MTYLHALVSFLSSHDLGLSSFPESSFRFDKSNNELCLLYFHRNRFIASPYKSLEEALEYRGRTEDLFLPITTLLGNISFVSLRLFCTHTYASLRKRQTDVNHHLYRSL